jgi:acyl-CoA thioester hydrolase
VTKPSHSSPDTAALHEDSEIESSKSFRYVHRQPVSLRDLDGFGHVNNAVYLTYLENARVGYLREVVGARTLRDIGNIMASVRIEYRAPASYGDVIEVGVCTERIGTKSFDLTYGVSADDGRLLAKATSIHVMFDYDRDESIAVPTDWRERISAYEGWAD